MQHVAALAECAQVPWRVVRQIVVEVCGGQRHLGVQDRFRALKKGRKVRQGFARARSPKNGFFVPPAAVTEMGNGFALWPAAAFVTAFGPLEWPIGKAPVGRLGKQRWCLWIAIRRASAGRAMPVSAREEIAA